jgi:hypothetical protein
MLRWKTESIKETTCLALSATLESSIIWTVKHSGETRVDDKKVRSNNKLRLIHWILKSINQIRLDIYGLIVQKQAYV